MIILRLVLLSVASLFCCEQIYAHAGGVDSAGCHHDKKAGGQHCHKSNVTVQSPPQILKPVNEQSNDSFEQDSAKNDGEIEQIQSNDGRSSELPDSSSKKSYTPSNDIDKEVIKKIQQLLKKGGYNLVLVDGILGRKTLNAITQFQKDNGLDKDGIPSNSLLMKLHEKYEGSK